MWLVIALISYRGTKKFDELAPECKTLVTISCFGTHFGYCPIYETEEVAEKYFPGVQRIKLPIEEVVSSNE
jgi:hypothetical protein